MRLPGRRRRLAGLGEEPACLTFPWGRSEGVGWLCVGVGASLGSPAAPATLSQPVMGYSLPWPAVTWQAGAAPFLSLVKFTCQKASKSDGFIPYLPVWMMLRQIKNKTKQSLLLMRINECGGDLSSATPGFGVKNELGLLGSSVWCGTAQGARPCVARCTPVRLWDQQSESWE